MVVPNRKHLHLRQLFSFLCALTIGLISSVVAVAGEPDVSLAKRFPEPPRALAVDDVLYLQLSYDVPFPAEIGATAIDDTGRATGFNGGVDLIAAGRGRVVLWVGAYEPSRITEVEVSIHLERPDGAETVVRRVPVEATWAEGVQGAGRAPPWVNTYLAESERRQEDYGQSQDEPGFFSWLLLLMTPGYFALQIFLLIRYRGWMRVAAGLPLLISVPVYGLVFGLASVDAGVGLLPMFLYLAPPPLFVYLVLLMLGRIAWQDYLRPERA